jgi:hypothetical protein
MDRGSDVLSGWLVYHGNVLAYSLCWQDVQGVAFIGISLAYMYYIAVWILIVLLCEVVCFNG